MPPHDGYEEEESTRNIVALFGAVAGAWVERTAGMEDSSLECWEQDKKQLMHRPKYQ